MQPEESSDGRLKCNFLPGRRSSLIMNDRHLVLSREIRGEAHKLVTRHQVYATDLADETERIARRSGVRPPKHLLLPSYWNVDDGFNPYKVRARYRSVGHAIARALRSGNYRPRAAVEYEVPKASGGMRKVSVFQVADNAVSRLYFKRLMAKNASRLSANCYAYRTDITIHDSVAEIAYALRNRGRLFIAEFDFSKFFDSISHEHIRRLLDEPRFFVTPEEKKVIWAFLTAPSVPAAAYDPSAHANRTVGVPQGTSLSLFLANLAGFPLDRQLERLGVGFVRYADDTVIWSDSYQGVCEAAAALEDSARAMSVTINLEKSEGISLLTAGGAPMEMSGKEHVDFVGYKIGTGTISIKDRNVRRIKEHVARLIYRNLLEEPKRGRFVHGRTGPNVDRDYVVAIRQIRRFLYGNLSERRLRQYLNGGIRKIHFKGLMSFYPIVDDDDLLKELDGWLVHTLWTSVQKRRSFLAGRGFTRFPPPFGLSRGRLIGLNVKSSTTGVNLDLRIPSFRRMSRLLRKAAIRYGASAIANPQSGRYYSRG